ncbi:MAG: adenylate kinase [Bacteroidetes bacterium]|nr:adenylate kinase [Bacteroidota bacterium]
MFNVILFGPPGAGKGTQSQKLSEKNGWVHISTGELLRKEIKNKTTLGIEAQRLIDDGNYVTDEMAFEIIKSEIERNKNAEGFVFDGFPRTIYQAEKFSEIVGLNGNHKYVLISIEVHEDVLIERLVNRAKESGRPDDRQKDIIQKRIQIYHQKTSCIKEYYKSQGKLETVDGNGEIDSIFDKICEVIEKHK